MKTRNFQSAFKEYAHRERSTAWKIWAAFIAVLLTYNTWDKRGAVIGLLALLVYAVIFTLASRQPRAVESQPTRHPVSDLLVMPVVFFLGGAQLSSWSLWTCAAVAVIGAVVVKTLSAVAASRRAA